MLRLARKRRFSSWRRLSGAFSWSPDGKTLAVAYADLNVGAGVKLWDTATGKEKATLKHTWWMLSLSWSPDSKTLAAGTGENSVKVWDTATGKERALLSWAPPGRLFSFGAAYVSWSPDGKTLAAGTFEKTVKLWDTATWKETATLTGHHRGRALRFLECGRQDAGFREH